jgi:NAD(P)-dependent dehydrogenase (short-subunit alcohol dehydrogenase family)
VSGPAYAAAKGGVISLTRNMAIALGQHGITVNAVNPGLTFTGMVADRDSALVREAVRRTPLGRLAEPEDIALPAVCLSSDLMGFVNGEVLEVNGGFYFD